LHFRLLLQRLILRGCGAESGFGLIDIGLRGAADFDQRLFSW